MPGQGESLCRAFVFDIRVQNPKFTMPSGVAGEMGGTIAGVDAVQEGIPSEAQ
jgi:hypothetical protein